MNLDLDRKYVIYFSLYFIIVYFISRNIFENLGFEDWVIYSVILSSISTSLFYLLLIKNETLAISLGVISILIICLINVNSLEKENHENLIGHWTIIKKEEVEIDLHFMVDNSAVLEVDGEKRKVTYSILNNDLITIFDEDNDILFEWDIKLLTDKNLTLSNKKDELKFIKIKPN